MSDMTREVYKDKADVMVTLNPFVEMPRMRVDTLNRLNELIKRDQALPIVKDGYDDCCWTRETQEVCLPIVRMQDL